MECRQFVALRHHFHRTSGIAEASGSVDPRRETEDDAGIRDGAKVETGAIDKALQTRSWKRVEQFQAEVGHRTVLARERRDVRSRGDGHEIQIVIRLFGYALTLAKRLDELEGDAAGGEILEGIRTAGLDGIEDGVGGGKVFGGLVVIADDDVDVERIRSVDCLDGRNSYIDGNNQGGGLVMCKGHAIGCEAEPLVKTVRNVVIDVSSTTT